MSNDVGWVSPCRMTSDELVHRKFIVKKVAVQSCTSANTMLFTGTEMLCTTEEVIFLTYLPMHSAANEKKRQEAGRQHRATARWSIVVNRCSMSVDCRLQPEGIW